MLTILKSKFSEVFYTPGNHELWTYKGGPNSAEKCLAVLEVCDEVGVLTTTTFLGDSIMITPLFSWWTAPNFATGGVGGVEADAEAEVGPRVTSGNDAGHVESTESMESVESVESKLLLLDTFDCLCMWPAEVGDPANPHNSGPNSVDGL